MSSFDSEIEEIPDSLSESDDDPVLALINKAVNESIESKKRTVKPGVFIKSLKRRVTKNGSGLLNEATTDFSESEDADGIFQNGKLLDLHSTKKQFDDINSFLDESLLDTIAQEDRIAELEKQEAKRLEEQSERLRIKQENNLKKVLYFFDIPKKANTCIDQLDFPAVPSVYWPKGTISSPGLAERVFLKAMESTHIQTIKEHNKWLENHCSATMDRNRLLELLQKIGVNKALLETLDANSECACIEQYLTPETGQETGQETENISETDQKPFSGPDIHKVKLIKSNVSLQVMKLCTIATVVCKQVFDQNLTDLMLRHCLACLVDEQVVQCDKVKDVVAIIHQLIQCSVKDCKRLLGSQPPTDIDEYNNKFSHLLSHLTCLVFSMTCQPKLLYKMISNLLMPLPMNQTTSLWLQFRLFLCTMVFCENTLGLDPLSTKWGVFPMIRRSQFDKSNRTCQKLDSNPTFHKSESTGTCDNSTLSLKQSTVSSDPVLSIPFIHPKAVHQALNHASKELEYLAKHNLLLSSLSFDEDPDREEVEAILAAQGIAKESLSNPNCAKQSIRDINKPGVSPYWLMLKFLCLQSLLLQTLQFSSLSTRGLSKLQRQTVLSKYYTSWKSFANNALPEEAVDDSFELEIANEQKYIDSVSVSLNIIYSSYLPDRIPHDLSTSLVFLEAKKMMLFVKNLVDNTRKYCNFHSAQDY